MSAQRTHDLSIKVGEYIGSDQQTKSRSRHIGQAFTTADGRIFIRIHAEALNPIFSAMARKKGEDSIILNLWPIEAKEKPAATAAASEDDDIPY